MILSKGILSQYLVLWTLNLVGIISLRHRGDFFFKMLQNWQSFLNYGLFLGDSKPNSWQRFSKEDCLKATVTAKDTLYWIQVFWEMTTCNLGHKEQLRRND